MEIRTLLTPSKTFYISGWPKWHIAFFWRFFFDPSFFLNVRLKSGLPLHYSDFHIVSFLTEFIYKSLSGIQAKTNLTSSLWFMISISPSNRAKTLLAIFHWKTCSHFFSGIVQCSVSKNRSCLMIFKENLKKCAGPSSIWNFLCFTAPDSQFRYFQSFPKRKWIWAAEKKDNK